MKYLSTRKPAVPAIALTLLMILLIASSGTLAQELNSIQIKTFDQNLHPLGNIEISINSRDYFAVNSKGTALIELAETDLPVKTIHIKNEQLEAASWNLAKGTLEIIVRKKSYHVQTVVVRNDKNRPLSGVKVTFKGKRTFSVTSDANGKVDIPLHLDEKIENINQFSIPDFTVSKLVISDNEQILFVTPVLPLAAETKAPQKNTERPINATEYFREFNLSKLDSIQSLTMFYAVFKSYQIADMNAETKARVDSKFNQLVRQLEDSVRQRPSSSSSFIGGINDTTLLRNDIKTLISQAREESTTLTNQRTEFDDKMRLIAKKLEAGIYNLDDDSRASLLSDLSLLERMLIENESRFFKNQNDYRQLINTIREKYFNLTDLENKLSESEAQRLEEQRIFREKLFAISAVVAVFAVLIVLLVYFSSALRKQKKELIRANSEIKNMNENLEFLVSERTQMLKEANKELDTFLYRASHDMRSPVRSVIGLCNIARRLSDGEPKELIERIGSTTYGMDKLLKKLSLISEINQPTGFTTVDIGKVIRDIEATHHELIASHQINFEVNCHEDIKLFSYRNVLQIILLHVIENALFYSTIQKVRTPLIQIDVQMTGEDVEISVFDNGIGIDPSIEKRVFEMFFKGTELSHGHGLGLYIVNKAVQALQGKIEVYSKLGVFSKFVITLPCELTGPHSAIEAELAESSLAV